MEANYREDCDFEISRLGENWRVTGCWKLRYDNSISWWDAETVRDGVTFHRIFRPAEIDPPPVLMDGEWVQAE